MKTIPTEIQNVHTLEACVLTKFSIKRSTKEPHNTKENRRGSTSRGKLETCDRCDKRVILSQ